ncbi:MAG: DUF4157 domain-containing protein, partial [Anaerolineae bacterium]
QRQEEEELQMKPVTAVQRQGETGSGGGEISADIEQSIQSARVAGQPLADNVRTPMENAFGTDFSGVKVHTDSQSDTLNQSLQARAFTTGQDIFFRQGEYNPGGSGGQELLAHELTHVVQQTGGGQLQRSPRNDKAQQEQAHEADSTDTASHQSPSTAETHSSHESVSTFRLTARIRRAETPIMNSERLTAHSEPSIVNSDSLPGEEHVETEEKPEDPEEMAQITITDKLTPALTYNATITHGGITPGAREFGLTNWTANVSGLNVKTVPSAFEVTATVNCPIKWEVHSLGRTDIDDSLSAAITKANYPTVASDLTPNMSSDGGRPPRTKFWAQDLTEQHEKYHADEFKTYGQASFTLAQTWLGTQTANSAAKAKELVKKIPGRMRTNLIATYVPNCETRAYGDGAPHYKKRADEVSLNGAAGKYK